MRKVGMRINRGRTLRFMENVEDCGLQRNVQDGCRYSCYIKHGDVSAPALAKEHHYQTDFGHLKSEEFNPVAMLFTPIRSGLASLLALASCAVAQNVKAIYLFKDVMQSDTHALKTSGFDTVLLFRIGILPNADLVYYSTGSDGNPVDWPVVTNGSYVGGQALTDKIISLKTAPTLIERVEVSLVSHDTTFQVIRDRIAADGTGASTPLYRAFDVLKQTWELDAFNNDDESVYHVPSTVDFAQMLGLMGYKYSTAPYTNMNFWADVQNRINAAVPGLLDRHYLQVYDGGAANNPGTWQTRLGMKIVPLLWVNNDYKPDHGNTPAQAQTRFDNWNSQYNLAGGGYWNDYDIEKLNSSYEGYGGALTSVFGQ